MDFYSPSAFKIKFQKKLYRNEKFQGDKAAGKSFSKKTKKKIAHSAGQMSQVNIVTFNRGVDVR